MNTVNRKYRMVFAILNILFLAVSINAFAQDVESRVLATSLPAVSLGNGGTCPFDAPIILSQTPNQSNGIFADADCAACGTGAQAVAENFSLGAATDIGQIVMYSGYFPGDLFPTPADPWNVTFHADAGGLPGADLNTQTVVPVGVVTGVTLFGVSEIEYTFTLAPFNLPAGTYWVEITTNSAGNADQAFWEVGDPDTIGNGIDGTAFATAVPGVAWNFTAAQDFAVTLCGPADMLPDPPAVPTLSQTGLTIMVLLLLLGAAVTVRRYN